MTEIATKQQLRWAFLRWAVVTVPLILLLGFASSRIAPGGAENRWYAMLTKPAGTPPDQVFGIVWSALYVLMGLALAMILHARGSRLRGVAIGLFVVQLLINLAWSPLFFGAHQVGAALGALIVLIVLALATTLVFARIRGLAAVLMVPYLIWLCYAAWLTWGIGQLNRDAATLVPSAANAQVQMTL